MLIKKATSKDFSTINSLAKIAFTSAFENILSKDQSEYMLDMMYSLEALKHQFENAHTYFIAYENDKEIGYFSIERNSEDTFTLQKIYLLPEFQGKGFGQKLFNLSIQEIKKIQPEECLMELHVNKNNEKAINFYKKNGMQISSSGDFDIGNGYFMNDYIMNIKI